MIPKITPDTYLIADLHFGHNNVINFEPSRKDAMGAIFETQEDMLVANWNAIIGTEDTVLVLGDFAFKQIAESTARLNGHKILIRGNHDKRTTQVYIDAGFEYTYDTVVYQDAVGHCWSNNYEDSYMSALVLDIEQDRIMFSHYPINVFEDCYVSRKYHDLTNRVTRLTELAQYMGVTKNVHGHTHSTCIEDTENLMYFNVSCENIGFKPIQLKDLL